MKNNRADRDKQGFQQHLQTIQLLRYLGSMNININAIYKKLRFIIELFYYHAH